jgi:AraC family transcriptional regulator
MSNQPASSLAARLLQKHVGTLAGDVSARATQAGLDRRRLTRVLDCIGANLEGDLTIARLAANTAFGPRRSR